MKNISRVRLLGTIVVAALTTTCGTSESQSQSQSQNQSQDAELAVMALRASAWDAISSEDWERSAREYTELTRLNPHFPAFWINLGISQLRLGRYDDAAAAFEQARVYGYDPRECYYDQACAYALAGQPDRAVAAMAEAYAEGYINDQSIHEDSDLRSLHDQSAFRALVGWPDKTVTDRTRKWNQDLDFFTRRIKEVHWRPFHHIAESEFDAEMTRIRNAVAAQSDAELRLALQALLVRLGDGHTNIASDYHVTLHGSTSVKIRFLPIRLFWFEDGMRIVQATREHKDLLGARVTAIGNMPVDRLIQTVDAYVARDNEWGAKFGIAMALTNHHTLTGLSLGDANKGYNYQLELPDGTAQTVTIRTGGSEVLDRIRLQEVSGNPLPASLKDKDRPLYMEMIGTALYVRMDGIQDTHDESFIEFSERIFTTAEQENAGKLILDVRDNPGGQGHLMQPLLHGLIKSERFGESGSLWVMIGRKTFSAAMAFAAQIDLHTKARFVGEPTGSRPNFVGESSIITLPYSGLRVSISSRYHQNGGSNDRRPWIAPDVAAVPTYALWHDGRDEGLEVLLK